MEIARYLVALGITSSLFGTFSEPLRWEWQTGYRHDELHWHVQASRGEDLKNLQFWENALVVCSIYRDIAIYAKAAGGYGKSGSTFDALGTFGYTVTLTPMRTYQVRLIPFFGCGANFEWLDHLMMKWFGPLIGGLFRFQPKESLQFEACYAYHWETLRFSAQHVKVHDGHNLAQSGWIRMDGIFPPYRVGVLAQIQYFSSRFIPISPDEIFKARWTAVSGAIVFSRRF